MKKLEKFTDAERYEKDIECIEIAFKNSEEEINKLRKHLHPEIYFICIEYGDELYSLAMPYDVDVQTYDEY